ncbi:Y_Y_Y domain-containing protein,putative transcriptional regulator [Belliella baltica DSM 15883]|uniref:Y_Y_Y domain-containing protein,putative transcriptional regulator n=1 Tax=Belliella baltica (strain DSM 15883 / CIP 108006 / LMG 21964 / BA134) TaxID=866536 RepID=I3Z7C2_BELBD|nr:two-component regulator propeller domain-containing protein [Belliella baltica]AFL85140.1 Y_Y_Y domain-containing protein,putative transcriptional regulator [Belliella baltica DSM 15883]
MNRKILFKTLFLIASVISVLKNSPSLAQQIAVGANDLPYIPVFFNNDNSLPQNTVFDIEKDDFGFLWIATEEGMVRYDGSTFSQFNKDKYKEIVSNIFYDVHKVENEGVWAASDNSLVLFNKRILKVIDAREVIHDNVISSIAKDKQGRLWIGTLGDRLYYLENDEIKVFESWEIAEGRKIQVIDVVGDNLLIGTNKGLYQFNLISEKITLVNQSENLDIQTILPNENEYFIGTKNNGIHHFKNNTLAPDSFNENFDFPFVNHIALDQNKNIWAGISEEGLYFSENGEIQKLDIEGLDENLIRIIYIDQDHIWLGTTGFGMIQLKPASIQMVKTDQEKIEGSVFPIYQHTNNQVFVGTARKGFYQIINNESRLFDESDGLTNNIIASITGRDQKIFFGTHEGVNSFDLETNTISAEKSINQQLKGKIVNTLFKDSNDQVWILTSNGGVYTMDQEERLTPIKIPEKFSHTDLITILEDSKKRIWLGSFATGMLSIENYRLVKEYQLPIEIKSKIIFDIYEDPEGDLWLATESGLISFDHDDFTEVKPINGLKSQAIYAIQDDNKGHIWLSSNSGLTSIPIEDLVQFKSSSDHFLIRSKSFNRSNGMANSETNGNCYPSSQMLNNGELWFPTIKGIAKVDPGFITHQTDAPQIIIEGIYIGDSFLDTQSDIEIPAGTFKFEINFNSIDFEDPENTQYYYRFKNQSTSLISLGRRNQIILTSIDPGTYTVEIHAYKAGKWSVPQEINFKVNGFFTESIYFKFLIFTFIFLMGALTIIYFKKFKEGKELEQKVKNRTADLEKSRLALENALKDIELQNTKLKEITWLQSHVVRAPLTRVMGLAHLLKNQENYKHIHKSKSELITELEDGLLEIDDIIREIHLKSEKLENN